VLRFVFVGYKLLGIAWAYGDLRVFCGGTIAIVMMSLLNILFFLDATGKFTKFIQMTHTEAGLDDKVVDMCAACAPIRLPAAKKEWSKLRGLHAMGAFRDAKKSK
jgi:hypothetical protein